MLLNYLFFSNDGYVIYGQYVLNKSITIDIPQLANRQVTVYLLKEGTPGNLQSNLTRINDQLIDWDAHQATNIQGKRMTLPVTLLGYSLFYIVVPPQTPSKMFLIFQAFYNMFNA